MTTNNVRTGRNILFVMATEQEYGPELRQRIQPLITGVGPIESAISIALRLEELVRVRNKPDTVVSIGSAGSKRYEMGTVWQVSSVSWRDMNASVLGFEKGVTPFANHPAAIPLFTPINGVATASLSTGSNVLDVDDYKGIAEDLVDMETFAVVRVCQRFAIPVVGLRGVSDGPGELRTTEAWTDRVKKLDIVLAEALDKPWAR